MLRMAINGGAGRMGHALVEAAASFDDIEIVRAFDAPGSQCLGETMGGENGVKLESSSGIETADFDVLADFSTPESTMQALRACAAVGRRMVIGTTGFDDEQRRQLDDASAKIPLMMAPNMSIGINLCLKLLEQTAATLGDAADVEIIEMHHRYKTDAPSGTALKMGEVIAATLGRDLDECAVFARHGQTGPRHGRTIGLQSIRAGDVVGEHTAMFVLNGERIEISHKATSRLAFAHGALRAAEWLANRPPGLYAMRDVLGF